MTLMDAPKFTARVYHHLGLKIAGAIILGIALCVFLFIFWNWPSEHRVNRFLDAVQGRDYTRAFGIWEADAAWQQHPERYIQEHYGYMQFLQDWGPNGSEGAIRSHRILYATSKVGNTVLLAVQINDKPEPLLTLSVSSKSHTIGFSPFALSPSQKILGWTRWGISFSQ